MLRPGVAPRVGDHFECDLVGDRGEPGRQRLDRGVAVDPDGRPAAARATAREVGERRRQAAVLYRERCQAVYEATYLGDGVARLRVQLGQALPDGVWVEVAAKRAAQAGQPEGEAGDQRCEAVVDVVAQPAALAVEPAIGAVCDAQRGR